MRKTFSTHYYIYYMHLQLTGSVLLMLLIPFYFYILSSNRHHVTMLRKVVDALIISCDHECANFLTKSHLSYSHAR